MHKTLFEPDKEKRASSYLRIFGPPPPLQKCAKLFVLFLHIKVRNYFFGQFFFFWGGEGSPPPPQKKRIAKRFFILLHNQARK